MTVERTLLEGREAVVMGVQTECRKCAVSDGLQYRRALKAGRSHFSQRRREVGRPWMDCQLTISDCRLLIDEFPTSTRFLLLARRRGRVPVPHSRLHTFQR